MNRKSLLLACGIIACASQGTALVWDDIRDGVLYIRPAGPTKIQSVWKPAWAADGHRETLYFQDGRGRLLDRRRIEFSETAGRHAFRCTGADGDSRLEIPGYSYRYYSFDVPDGARTVFEPTKTHFSMRARSGDTFYFRVPAGRAFAVCGKRHDGVKQIRIYDASGEVVRLPLVGRSRYPDFDRREFPAEERDSVWRVEMVGGGKVAFWLDGIPNYFALREADLFVPKRETGAVGIEVGKRVVGPMPSIGAGMEFADLPSEGYKRIGALGLNAAGYYVFEDAFKKGGAPLFDRDTSWLRVYEKELGVDESIRIFCPDRRVFGGRPITASYERTYAEFIRSYIEHHDREADLRVSHLAFFDEPNSLFRSAGDYAARFGAIATALKQDPAFVAANARIAAPESSGFLNGPTKSDAVNRIGSKWLEVLLRENADLVDSVSWHEWMVRDLIATEWYAESVNAASNIVQRWASPQGPAKEIVIGQTNISSGGDVSRYEQETFFAALWWASVVAQSAGTGKLTMINWFPAIDDDHHRKGFMKEEDGEWKIKPVGVAMQFMGERLLGNVLETRADSVEVDALATTTNDRRRIHVLVVNKFPRTQEVEMSIALPSETGSSEWTWSLYALDATLINAPPQTGNHPANDDFEFRRTMPGETIWVLELVAGDTAILAP